MQKLTDPIVEISFKCNHYLPDQQVHNDGDDNKVISFSIPSTESKLVAVKDMEEIRKKIQSSSTWKHDHGDLPNLQLKQPYLDILLSLIEAKSISDDYLTKQIQLQTSSNISSTLEVISSSSSSSSSLPSVTNSKSVTNSIEMMAQIQVNEHQNIEKNVDNEVLIDDEGEGSMNIDVDVGEEENSKRSRTE